KSCPKRSSRPTGCSRRPRCSARAYPRLATWYTSVPADRGLVEVEAHLLGLHVFLDAVEAELAADAALLVASPRELVVGRVVRVHPGDAGPQRSNDPVRAEDVGRPHGGGEAIGGVVGEGDGLLLVGEGQDRQDGAEDLLAGDAHVGAD